MLSIQFMDALFDTSRMLEADQQSDLGRRGLTRTSTHALWVLHHDGACTQAALAAALEVTPRHVTTLVDTLVGLGFAARTPHPTDRRAVLVGLTPAGEDLMAEMTRQYEELSAALLDGVPSDDLRAATEVLELVRGRIRSMIDAGRST